MAIPLDTVTRLEEFPRDRIEHAGSREVVQYRGQILPLVRLSHLLGAYGEEPEGDTVSVVVYSEGGRSVALVVDRIVDIAENSTHGPPRRRGGRPGRHRGDPAAGDRAAGRAPGHPRRRPELLHRPEHDEMLVEA